MIGEYKIHSYIINYKKYKVLCHECVCIKKIQSVINQNQDLHPTSHIPHLQPHANNNIQHKYINMSSNNKKLVQLFKNNNNFISIGYNCFFKKFLKIKFLNKKETNFFDNIGISMWGINELLLNDFEDFFNPANYKQIKIKNNENNKNNEFLSNVKYYIRFPHDLLISKFNGNYNGQYFNNFINMYSRRKTRLYDLLTNCKKVVFLRLEEDIDDRIIYPEYMEKFKTGEFENLLVFTEIIKNKFPNLNFTVIFVSRTVETNIYLSNNIIVLNTGEYAINDWKKSQDELENIFLSNYELIQTYFQNKL